MYFFFIIFISCGLVYIKVSEIVFAITILLTLVLFKESGANKNQRVIPYSMFLLAMTIIVINDLSFIDIVSRSKPFTLTIMMILSVTLISSLINANGMLGLYRKFSSLFKIIDDNSVMMISSAITSPFLNMATPAIYGKVFKKSESFSACMAANNVKKGMMIAMLVSPTFAPIALVIGSHPNVSWGFTVLYSVPLVFITVFFYTKIKKIQLNVADTKIYSETESGVLWIVSYLLFLSIFIMFFSVSIISSIIMSALLTVVSAIFYDYKYKSGSLYSVINKKSKETIGKINNEALIFISSGILLISISDIAENISFINSFVMGVDKNILIVFILLFLPLLSFFKLHPIIGFTLIQPVVYVYHDLFDIQKYMLWICYWVISLQISPISVINITTSNSFDIDLKSITTRSDFLRVYLLGILYSLIIIIYGEV